MLPCTSSVTTKIFRGPEGRKVLAGASRGVLRFETVAFGVRSRPGETSVKRCFRSHPPNATLNRQAVIPSRFAAREKQRVVTKRVPFGELVYFLRKETPNQLTPGAETSAAGCFAFTASSRKGLRRFLNPRRALRFEREQIGSDRNPQGSLRTPKSRAKTLGISD
jgi:hypothetical protein